MAPTLGRKDYATPHTPVRISHAVHPEVEAERVPSKQVAACKVHIVWPGYVSHRLSFLDEKKKEKKNEHTSAVSSIY